MIPRFTEFYIPVLKVLEDMGEHEINELIMDVATLCNISEEDRLITTKGGTQLRYHSNISWAVTDLYQGGFISRSSRGIYSINFEGMLLLEENPEHPDRDYLRSKSEKFRDFMNRKSQKEGNPNLTSLDLFETQEEVNTTTKPNTNVNKEGQTLTSELKELESMRNSMARHNLNTTEIDIKISSIKKSLMIECLLPIINPFIKNLKNIQVPECSLIIDLFTQDPKVYLNLDKRFQSPYHQNNELVCLNNIENSVDNLSDSLKSKAYRKPTPGFNVYFEDGYKCDSGSATDIFVAAIEHMNVKKVASLGLQVNKMNLVSLSKPEKYTYRKIADKYYVTTNLPNWRKKEILEKIGTALKFKLVVRHSAEDEMNNGN